MEYSRTRTRHRSVTRYPMVCLFVSLVFSVLIYVASSSAQTTDATAAPTHDYLKVAINFAECMIEHGRDRYGEVHSPLFAVLLTRENPPHIGPYPIFDAPAKYDWQKQLDTPFRKFNYNRCLNYPTGLGGEGPHKITVYGCDIYEDRNLYVMLMDLGRITGAAKYRTEAEKALTWWFTKTMGPAGLYPWGEHLGWDFEYECPTYFKGPSKHLYAACYHEIKDTVPFLDFLAALPAAKPGERTLLEKYALGVWNAHYWDQERCIYCRHGDYTGQDRREGSLLGFPAHQGAHLRLWIKTYLTTKDTEVKHQMSEIVGKVLDVQIARARKYGFIPFTFETDVQGKAPEKTGQSDRLGRHATALSVDTRRVAPAISTNLKELGMLLLGDDGFEQVVRDIETSRAEGHSNFQGALSGAGRPSVTVADLSGVDTSVKHAREIMRRVAWYRQYRNSAYLRAAEEQARMAFAMFCDDKSPLPRAYAGAPRKTVAGGAFPDFYFRGAKLMHAFALLGEALGQAPRLQNH